MALDALPTVKSSGNGGGTSRATGSATPTAYTLQLVHVYNGRQAGSPNVPTISGHGLTWTQIDIARKIDFNNQQVTLWYAVTGGSPSAGTVTADFAGQSQDDIAIYWVEWPGAALASPIVQHNGGTGGSSSTSLSVNLGTFADAGNGAFEVMLWYSNPGTITPDTDYSLVGSAQATSHGYSHRLGRNTADTTPGCTWVTARAWAAIACEVRALAQVSGAGGLTQPAQTFAGTGSVQVLQAGGGAAAYILRDGPHQAPLFHAAQVRWAGKNYRRTRAGLYVGADR